MTLARGQPGIIHGLVHDRSMADDGAPGGLMREHPQFLPPPGVRFRAAIWLPVAWMVCILRGLRLDPQGTMEGE
jgi:hypothetical protein